MRIALPHSVLLLAFTILFLAAPFSAQAVTSFRCPSGEMSHAATAEEVAAANGGIREGIDQVCPEDAALGISNSVGGAKQYLETLAPGLPAWKIEQLNPAFSACAAKFLKFAADNGVAPKILDGVRSQSEQNVLCNRYRAGIGGIAACGVGEHVVGIAIDVRSESGRQSWLWANAPQFGLVFYLGSADSVHFVPLNSGSFGKLQKSASVGGRQVTAQILASAQQNLASGGGCLTPGFSPSVQDAGPTSPFQDALRKLLGIQQPLQPTLPASTGQATTIGTPTGGSAGGSSSSGSSGGGSSSSGGGSPTACNPQYYCENGTYYYHSSSCQDIAIQKCPNGCAGDTCALPTTSASPNSPSSQGGGSSAAASSTSTPQSAIDIIQQYANPGSTVEIGTATPIALNPDIGNSSAVLPGTANNASQLIPTQGSSGLPGSQQTFVSSDLSNSRPVGSAQSTFALGILESMKQSLIWALNYLQPFGGVSSQMFVE